MFGIDDAIGAIGVGSSIAGALFRRRPSGSSWSDSMTGLLSIQENQLRQKQMNLDANRRKRDIIRQAQVATANAEASANASGALNGSGVEGARAGISGQAGVNFLGVSQNQEIGNQMFTLENLRGMMLNKSRRDSIRQNGFADYLSQIGTFLGSGDTSKRLGQFGQWGFDTFTRV